MKRKAVALVLGGGRINASKSGEPLDLIPVLGRPVSGYVLDAVTHLDPEDVVFLHPDGERTTGDAVVEWAECLKKDIPLRLLGFRPSPGPAERQMLVALRAAAPILARHRNRDVLFVSSKHILLRSRTIKALLAAHRRQGCALTLLVTAGGGEEWGTALFRAEDVIPLLPALAGIRKGSPYATLTELLVSRNKKVGLYPSPHPDEACPLSGPAGLTKAVSILRGRKNEALGRSGVRLLDPQTVWVDWDAKIGPGTVIYPSVNIEGASKIGRNCRIYPHVRILNCRIQDGVNVLDCTVMEESVLEKGSQVGPFSRLRPGTLIRAGARVGNFVEMKNTVFGARSKANHLSYLGDSLVGEGVNIGAGTITCNYDGFRKSRTNIGAGVFIGSGTELIAPVTVGKGAYVAAGSTITKDVAPESLAIARARQQEKPGWVLEKMRERKKGRKG